MQNINILIVDDIEANRVSVNYLINEYIKDVSLFLAESGEEALKIAYQNSIDIIILDIQMPGMDGFETAIFLKKSPKTKNIPIIFLTAAFKEEEFQQKGFEIGAVDYLTKPIENHQLINKLNLYIEIILKNKELAKMNQDLSEILKREIHLKEKMQKQQKTLIEQSKMAALGEMISNIAHQWRQPLSVISTCATGMKIQRELGNFTDEEFDHHVNSIVRTTNYLSRTIDDFRDFARGDSKKVEFNLSENIEKCLGIELSILKNNYIKVIKDLDDSISLFSLKNGLLQALINIINNAKDVLILNDEEERFIFIESKKDDKNIYITIKDNGGGVPIDIIDKIFEPYFTTKHQSQGTGLGLNMTYNIIKDGMDGDIVVTNKEYTYENKNYIGAEFKITLPLP